MSIQWFPGHMHLTRQAIAERVKAIDVVIEMLDARLPGSSANPLMRQLTSGKPTLKILNKQDMADPERTALWLAHYNAQPDTQAISLDASVTAPARALIDACHWLAPHRGGMFKPMRVLICGIPNVGKSTLINTLKGRKAAKTGDEAGVTRTEARIVLADDFYLYDTPGMLWPRIIVPESGYNLAASGAVGKNAYDEEEVAYELLAKLKTDYPALMEARYQAGLSPEAWAQATDDALLEAIGRKRGALAAGGKVNIQKAAELVIADFRAVHIGRITLETPEQFARWLKAGQQADKERAERKKALREAGLIGPARGGARRPGKPRPPSR
ncbi:ribosome biogenesis GTPase YlqF [Hydrogenophaga electricum]|uniref:Ribosome biogenesis GTPase A n=1 Tax=Hydrogenophaga electricum TaxID=1230953 RepID=A0ABQ6C4I8_9BURK|nr:ribosome biogenesis GTPase YlqF [Hydrogenophaga electricum]GLS13251.1 ribosome biogenesis GTPase A [Hydrogenophaga electricum]